MSHRERVAWLSLIAMAVTFGPYFALVAMTPPEPMPDLRALWVFAAAMTVQMLILGGGQLWLRIRSPEDARAPADERELEIGRRSLGAAYYVLIAGMIVVGCVMPFNSSGWALVNASVAAIVLAESVHHGVALCGYRWGWND